MEQIEYELVSLYQQVLAIKKEKGQVSPGLSAAIANLESKKDRFIETTKIWYAIKKVYPNYDR